MRILCLWATALVLALALLSCTPARDVARARKAAAAENLDAAIANLRVQLAEDPHDVAAHLGLGLALARKGRGGAALSHLAVAYRNGRLFGPDRAVLADLYLRRARARLALGDGDAYRDLERAIELGKEPEPELSEKLYLAAALAELRAGTANARARARALLAKAGAAGKEKIAALADPERARVEALAATGRWAWEGAARRIGHSLLSRAIFRGAREPALVADYIAAETWWRGKDAVLVVPRPPAKKLAIFEVTAEPRVVLRVANEALMAAMAGEGAYLALLARRVDIATLLAATDVSPALRAPLLRAQGERDAASAALLDAIEQAPSLSAEERTIVIAEAAAQGKSIAVLEHLLGLGQSSPAAYHAAARAARARGDVVAEARILAAAEAGVGHAYFRESLDLGAVAALSPPGAAPIVEQTWARWQQAIAPVAEGARKLAERWRVLAGVDTLEPPAPLFAVRLGWPSPARIALRLAPERAPEVARGLAKIEAAYAQDPARADRLANHYVAGKVAIGERGPLVAALFAELGDPARARAWSARILAQSPAHPPYLEAAALALARARDPDAALTLLTRAAALSGDAGATWLRGARGLLDGGQPLAGLTAARRAMQLAPAGSRKPALETVAQAAIAAGRRADATRALSALIEEAGPERRAAARGYVRRNFPGVLDFHGEPVRETLRDRALRAWQTEDPQAAAAITALAAADPTDPALAIAAAEIAVARGSAARAHQLIDVARAWHPRHVRLRQARLALTAVDDPAYATVTAELLLIGVADPDSENAAAAMTAAAGALTTLGHPERARLARQAAAALSRAID